MMLPEQWEGIAQDRQRDWQREMQQRNLLAHLPKEAPRWRSWTGGGMVWVGARLMRLGERMAPRECQEGVSVVG